jgi:hypothetical protein
MSSSNGSTAEITDNIRNWTLEQSRNIKWLKYIWSR